MQRITATDAARGFADLLDAVERDGETFVIERRGKAVAQIAPAPRPNGERVVELLQNRPGGDWHDVESEIRAVRALLVDDMGKHWKD
jgi:antitoxin (DNA-binding transcriptional repressor) of toxin-antitoxin stability system